ncbi:MAG: DNA alkylation repair protein [Firmicutes bacterium]|nr:DNA alkylation repair protein [Bacillota bacterium]
MIDISKELFALKDDGYKAFHSKLMPTIDPNTIIGIRIPVLRKFAKEFGKTEDAALFLRELPHRYYEENNVHGFLIENKKDFDEVISDLNEFLPYVDNWATCDMITPKVFRKHHEELYPHILKWLGSNHTYTIRFGIEMLMKFYLDDHFDKKHLDLVSAIRSEEYYVNMMIAWYVATALAKQYDATLPYLEHQTMATWTHNKAIQKAKESYRITTEQKAYLNTLKIK